MERTWEERLTDVAFIEGKLLEQGYTQPANISDFVGQSATYMHFLIKVQFGKLRSLVTHADKNGKLVMLVDHMQEDLEIKKKRATVRLVSPINYTPYGPLFTVKRENIAEHILYEEKILSHFFMGVKKDPDPVVVMHAHLFDETIQSHKLALQVSHCFFDITDTEFPYGVMAFSVVFDYSGVSLSLLDQMYEKYSRMMLPGFVMTPAQNQEFQEDFKTIVTLTAVGKFLPV